jgi:hypothetical protein
MGRGYHFTRYSVQGRTANRRMFSVFPEVEWGSFYSGDRVRVNGTLSYRAAPGMMFNFTSEWNRVKLAEGEFRTRLFRFVAETQFSPWMAVVNNVQYDSQSDILGWQSRFRWILQPGNDLYFVYIHNWKDDPVADRFQSLDRRATSKLLYTFRF